MKILGDINLATALTSAIVATVASFIVARAVSVRQARAKTGRMHAGLLWPSSRRSSATSGSPSAPVQVKLRGTQRLECVSSAGASGMRKDCLPSWLVPSMTAGGFVGE